MFELISYTDNMREKWDRFVLENSTNGTFLQTRNFLDYHPSERFVDSSILAVDSGNIYAVIPACLEYDISKDSKVFYSHKGSSYGGIIISNNHYNTTFLNDLLQKLCEYWNENSYNEIILKLTSNLIAQQPSDLLEYMLSIYGFQSYTELNTFIDYSHYKEPVLSNLNKGKKSIIKGINSELIFRSLDFSVEYDAFYQLLVKTLKKYNSSPIHTIFELHDLSQRLGDQLQFYGVYLKDQLLAAGMVFEFHQKKVAHTQYLAADPDQMQMNANTFLYYSLINYYKKMNCRYLSWGISTENKGALLNNALVRHKESFGGCYSLNRIFFKQKK